MAIDDRNLEIAVNASDQIAINQKTNLDTDRSLITEVCENDEAAEQILRNSESLDENTGSNQSQESCSCDQDHTLPIIQRVAHLSTKIQDLKKEHKALHKMVKGITNDPFPVHEVLNTLQLLNAENKSLKEKCVVTDAANKSIKEKYLKEFSERKHLNNEVVKLKGNIRVFCRCRPLNEVEITNGSAAVVEYDSSLDTDLQIICPDLSRKHFKFDHVFRPDDTQEAVFAQTKPIVTSVLDGYNVCIFAYGQTGTGKTFTMEGTPEHRGVNYRTLEELFRIAGEREGVMRYELFVSMLEVYNEKIRDLLVENSNEPDKKLEIKQAAEGTQEVQGLVEARVYGTEEVWDLLKSGGQSRSVGSTRANQYSSRSHCLLRVTVKGENVINGQKTRSHLWLIDLAGSERVGKTDAEGERLKESQFINKSLSALGDVISALASKTPHIPYRNSKLTHLLQSSLGGDCKTLMFVQISPTAPDLCETQCSLNFASRVRGVENGPARKQTDASELLRYKQMAEKSKHDEKEIRKLQDNVQSLQIRLGIREHSCKNLQDKIRDLENQLAEERKTRQKQESRAFAMAGQTSLLKQAVQKPAAERKPPLGPSKMRVPLRRISNFLPLRSQSSSQKTSAASYAAPSRIEDKENLQKSTLVERGTKEIMKPRRITMAIRPPPQPARQVIQPKRRVSVATLHPQPNTYMTTPLQLSSSQNRSGTKFMMEARRISTAVGHPRPKHSSLSKYLQDLESRTDWRAGAETTPIRGRFSSKFVGSPTTVVGSSKPKHPTVLTLQRKTVVWSPLKWRGMNNHRRSLAWSSSQTQTNRFS